jgi:hypothetical protein
MRSESNDTCPTRYLVPQGSPEASRNDTGWMVFIVFLQCDHDSTYAEPTRVNRVAIFMVGRDIERLKMAEGVMPRGT